MFGHPRFARCPDCGATVACSTWYQHACDRARLVEYQLMGLEAEVDAYLASPRGLFESWWATRQRRCAD